MPQDFSSWAAMHGYGAYIWSAYALAFAVIAGLAFASLRRLSRAQKRLRELESE